MTSWWFLFISLSFAICITQAGDCSPGSTTLLGSACDKTHYCNFSGYKCCSGTSGDGPWCCSATDNTITCDTAHPLEHRCNKTTGGTGTVTQQGIACGEKTVCSGTNLQCCGEGRWCCSVSNKCGTSPFQCLDSSGHPTSGITPTQGTLCSTPPTSSVCVGSSLFCCKSGSMSYCCNAESYNACGVSESLNQCVQRQTMPGYPASAAGDSCGDNYLCGVGSKCCGSSPLLWCCPQTSTCSKLQRNYCVPSFQRECKSAVSEEAYCCEKTGVCCEKNNFCCFQGQTCCGSSCCSTGQKCCNERCCLFGQVCNDEGVCSPPYTEVKTKNMANVL